MLIKHRRRVAFLTVLLFSLFCLSACATEQAGPADSANVYYQFTDDTGVEITLPEKPTRVAVLFSSFAQVWELAGGKVDITVGESVERGFASQDAVLVDGGAGKTINSEALMDAAPDFVICSADLAAQSDAAALLNGAGIPAACFHVDTFNEYLHMLKICTDITGDSAAYEEYGADVAKRVDEILSAAPQETSDKKNILFIRAGSSASATKAKRASDHFAAAMLEEMGIYNIADNAPILLDGLSIEEIIDADPDYIFISTMGDEEAAKKYMDSVLAEPTWQSLTAVQTGNYSYLPKDLFQFKPNNRWDEAYAFLAGLLYGE